MWAYIPSTFLDFAPGSEGLSLGSDSPCPGPVPSVTWRGKDLDVRSWRRVWKKESWTRLLSGVTCGPSAASRGMVWWILSLRASRVSLSASPGNGWHRKTTAGCGRTWLASFAKRDLASSSWRTSQGCLFGDSETFSGTWPRWGSLRNGECSPRNPWEPRTNAIASSSWPTPTARDWRSWKASEKTHLRGSRPLNEVACLFGLQGPEGNGRAYPKDFGPSSWPTPTVGDAASSGSAAYARTKTHNHGTTLTDATSRKMGGKLNPLFVEWLMGWPPGWTDFGPVGTASFLSWRQRHSELLRIALG